MFLRINTGLLWHPSHPISLADNPEILDWDSHVELRQLFRFPYDELSRALARRTNVIGRMNATEANAVAWAARRSPVLSDEHQQLVWDNLSALI